MKRSYRRVLKKLLKNYYKDQLGDPSDTTLFEQYSTNKEIFGAFQYLAAKKLIVLKTDIFSKLYDVEITEKGITYFDDARQDKFRFWFPVIISMFALIIAIISLISDISTPPPQKEKQSQITPTESTSTFYNTVPSFSLPPIP